MVGSIKAMMENISVGVVQYLREGNTLADFFTNLVFVFSSDFQYNNLEHMQTEGKTILMLDKLGTLNIRRSAQDS